MMMSSQLYRPWIYTESADILKSFLNGTEREIMDLNLSMFSYKQIQVILFTRTYFGDIIDDLNPGIYSAQDMFKTFMKIRQHQPDLFSFNKSPVDYINDYNFILALTR